MKFGTYIKGLREKQKWTQPQASEQIGIEQSYLSKLENGKSYPSEEIYNKLQNAYSFATKDLTDLLDYVELNKLAEIQAVRDENSQALHKEKRSSRIWLIWALASIMLAGFFYGAYLVSEDTLRYYKHRSLGVLEVNETDDAFEITQRPAFSKDVFPDKYNLQQAMLKRLDVMYVTNQEDLGSFTKNVDNGRRFFKVIAWTDSKRFNHGIYFLIPALISMLASFMCVFISFRWK
jgi:transcriptional regulator with XRE-family HTH domain